MKFDESHTNLQGKEYVSLYNNLGVVSLALGKFDQALKYNYMAEKYIVNEYNDSQYLADIFINRGNLLNIKKSFDVSIEYLEKSIRIYQNFKINNNERANNLSSAYINISIALTETKRYEEALIYLKRNVVLSSAFNLSTLPLTYLNMAKTYARLKNNSSAEEFYKKSILSFISQYGKDYNRLAEVYFDYGIFLLSEGKHDEALSAHKKALFISLNNYGVKHTLVSLSYKHIADDYLKINKLDSSLYFYQKSLAAVSPNFNNPDIFH